MAFKRRALQAGAILGTALMVALTGATTGALGQQNPGSPPAARFFGNITVNGSPAHTGAVVTAYNGTTLCGTSSGPENYNANPMFPNIYYVDIDSSNPACTSTSNPISFKVDGVPANETGQLP